MGTINLKIKDELEKEFREAVYHSKGMKKGNLTESLEEALDAWIKEQKKHQSKKG